MIAGIAFNKVIGDSSYVELLMRKAGPVLGGYEAQSLVASATIACWIASFPVDAGRCAGILTYTIMLAQRAELVLLMNLLLTRLTEEPGG